MRKLAAAAAICMIIFLLFGCTASQAPCEKSFFAMNTMMNIKVWGENASDYALDAERFVQSAEEALSVTLEDSEISLLNADGSRILSDDLYSLLKKTVDLCNLTDGALSVTLYPVTALWGFTTGNYAVPSEEALTEALLAANPSHLILGADNSVSLEAGAAVDLGAVAKGWAAQKVCDSLKDAGVDCAILSLGGNVQTLGSKPDGTEWSIGIRDPEDESRTAAVIHLQGSHAVVTSGGYQRYFEQDGVRYCHIIDPSTGKPVDSGLASVTVIADDGLYADALSTALYVMGLDAGIAFWADRQDFDVIWITEDGTIYGTDPDCVSGAEVKAVAP